MLEKTNVKMLEKVVVRFSGDSGDGMQLVGNIFSNVSAGIGNQISTFPDYPAEVRAPQGTLSGVSGFQVSVGKGVHTPGDKADVLVSMNPAALKQNVKFLKEGGVAIVDIDCFKKSDLEKALFTTDDPYTEIGLKAQVVEVPMTSMVKAALADSGMDLKSITKCKNMFALGLVCWLFDRPLENAIKFIENKFAKKPAVAEANAKVIRAGYDYGNNIHASVSTYRIETDSIRPGVYTDVNGNTATAWGLVMAAEKANLPLFLGSYPITPATDVLHELAKRKDLGVKACQMEDEIAGICSAIGASFAGNLAATSTSGPGIALKGEAMGLAVIAGAVISVFMRSNVAKQISCIGMMAWPLVVCIATWIFDVHDGYTVGEIIQEANEEDGFFKDFMKMINPISIIGYTVCSIGTGMLILKTLPKKVEDESVPNPPVSSKDDEIARLKAEIEALREKSQAPQN